MKVWLQLQTVFFVVCSAFLFPAAAAEPAALPAGSDGYAVWESPSRFYEFDEDGTFRIVLKPYYSYVYEPSAPMSWSCVPVPETGDCLVSVAYPGNKTAADIPLFVHDNGIYFNFFVCTAPENSAETAAENGDVSTTEPAAGNGAVSASNHNGETPDGYFLNGFWQQTGNRDLLRLYDAEPYDEIYCWYFHGNRFWLIRYWQTDLEYRRAAAVIPHDGVFEIPRFLQKDGQVYSCVTLNEKTVRHYWSGTYEMNTERGELLLFPAAVNRPKSPELSHCPVLKDCAAVYRDDGSAVYVLPVTVSAGSLLFAPGNPDAVPRSAGSSGQNPLDSLISAHNSRRRPPRTPLLGYMELDFRWEEVQALSGPELDYMRKYLSEFTVSLFGDSFFRDLQK